jgi:polyisoprenoid-binding protein YceI
MNKTIFPSQIPLSLLGLFAIIAALAAQTGSTDVIEVATGAATFESVTNMPGIDVKGKSSTLSAHVEVSREAEGLVLQQIVAALPVKSLATGMKVRDEHMRKYIFTTSDGREPDVQFTAEKGMCPGSPDAHEFMCRIQGALSIRGVAKPLEMVLHVKEQAGSSVAYHASGDGIVKLSDYGIDPPSQFGVRPANEVKIHLDFTGKQKRTVASAAGAPR